MVECSCTKEILNEIGQYVFPEWACANKSNKSLRPQNSGRTVEHIPSAKSPECKGSISPSRFHGLQPD